MKLNHDCVRDLLLLIEEVQVGDYIDVSSYQLKNYSSEDLCYTADKLLEAGYINGKIYPADNVIYWRFSVSSLTWTGHEFLDNIRDDGVWKDTKKVASKLTSVSLSMLEKISVTILTTLIKTTLDF